MKKKIKIEIEGVEYLLKMTEGTPCLKCALAMKCDELNLEKICRRNHCFKQRESRTFFQMLRELGEWKPQNSHTTSREEQDMLKKHFSMDDMSANELKNLRDSCVTYYTARIQNGCEKSALKAMMSITAVIDSELMAKKAQI